MNGKKRRVMTGIGISSLIIIFVVLAMTIITLLNLLTVRQDLESAKIAVRSQEAYYAADTLVTEKLAMLYALCNDEQIPDKQAAATELGFESRNTGRGEITFTLEEKADDTISVILKAVYTGGTLTVSERKTVSLKYYVNENSLPLWDGETLPNERGEN